MAGANENLIFAVDPQSTGAKRSADSGGIVLVVNGFGSAARDIKRRGCELLQDLFQPPVLVGHDPGRVGSAAVTDPIPGKLVPGWPACQIGFFDSAHFSSPFLLGNAAR